MKTALCISGITREIKRAYKSIKKEFIDVYNPDIFFQSWDKGELAKIEAIKSGKFIDNFYKRVATYSIDNKEPQLAVELLKPKLYRLEPIIDFLERFAWIDSEELKTIFLRERNRSVCMWYNIYRCDLLRREYEEKNNFKYDLVIRSRPDVKQKPAFKFENIDPKTLYLKKMRDYNPTIWQDSITIGDSESMSEFSELFLHLEEMTKEMWEKIQKFNLPKNSWFDPHVTLLMHIERLEKKGFTIKKLNWEDHRLRKFFNDQSCNI